MKQFFCYEEPGYAQKKMIWKFYPSVLDGKYNV